MDRLGTGSLSRYHPAPTLFRDRLMTDMPPDRLSANPGNPFYDAAALERGVGVRFKGVDKNNVDEYCVSEGWVRLTAGAAKDRKGNAMTVKLQGPVEPYFRDMEALRRRISALSAHPGKCRDPDHSALSPSSWPSVQRPVLKAFSLRSGSRHSPG